MCGIIGFTGNLQADNVLIHALEQLEYRGYDSAGIALRTEDCVKTIKKVGKVSNLKQEIDSNSTIPSTCGIGHTRWATHGGVTDVNAHPHTVNRVTLIHNGIIENYDSIAKILENEYTPVSQTDTEIAAMLLDHLYDGDPINTIKEAVKILKGAYAFLIMFHDRKDSIYGIRNVSPLVATHTDEGSFIASDVTALIKYSKDYFVLPENHIFELKKDEILVWDMNQNLVKPEMLSVDWDVETAQKKGFEHFMLKEIFEQPEGLRNTLLPRIHDGVIDFTVDKLPNHLFTSFNRIYIVACGSAMYAGLVGKNRMEQLLRIPVVVEVASEFRYEDPIVDENTLVIIISQSGETVDTLAALRLAHEKGAKTLSIVNVKGSSIARESDYVLYTHVGPEIAVATTKGYTSQMLCLYMITCKMAYERNIYDKNDVTHFLEDIDHAIQSMEKALEMKDNIKEIAKNIMNSEDAFIIGRGLDYALSYEGALKLKEISYIHSEAYTAGELKHGTLALITEGVPVIALATQESVYDKVISNIREVKARGANVILISNGTLEVTDSICDYLLTIPKIDDRFTPFSTVVILQLLAYYVAKYRGLEIDKPRNLAKSVTVE
ncbi:glutamine--fructose-6-phosphate transaminase (isomerizing) [Anaeromicropila herbilytica]|uniref:Glutamine--fructose-6-phosphate aminotransferase [isomerizing] n=1 Tax=Anaeromicropila herbilytica TaxID=2785025 RepID=A0A7R7IDS5_9FIRM|nr:glutamine--fructose-6-phosphate transaminase (isomerizing) [Anaeromicropila herbilytica]BCN30323.1 glutamine--fructose-6-phosphate aminotransferase [isomerizing] [Anaeromicropila herbilytica]